MSKLRAVFFISASTLLIASFQNCGGSFKMTDTTQIIGNDRSKSYEGEELTANQVFAAKCATCHNPGASLPGPPDILDESALLTGGFIVAGDPAVSPIWQAVDSGIMPPPGSPQLTLKEIAAIHFYILNLDTPTPAPAPSPAPEPSPAPGPSPSPAPSPAPEATFTQVKTQVLSVSCTRCHSGMSSYNGTVRYVVARNPERSELFQVINSGEMPRGGPKLSQEKLDLVFKWIQEGALNN